MDKNKIINAHAHIIEADKVFSGDNARYLEYLREIPSFEKADEVIKMVSVETFMEQMDEAGIDISVIFAMYSPILFASNEFVAATCQRYKGRLMGFASVDINSGNAPAQLEEAIVKLGLRGLKLHPPLQGFFANDPKIWPVYQKASDLGIPVVFHVGSTPFGSLVKISQADPVLIDEVACAFPRLKIMLTHLGTLWHNESFMIVEKNPNVYIDTAAYPYEIKELLSENLIRRVGADKFIFGTDFPMPYEGKMHRLKDFTDVVHELNISTELKEKIFYHNFINMLESK